MAEALLHLSVVACPLQAQRLAAHFLLFCVAVTHRLNQFLIQLVRRGQIPACSSLDQSTTISGVAWLTRAAICVPLAHPRKTCQRPSISPTRASAFLSVIAMWTTLSRPIAIDNDPRSTGKTVPVRSVPSCRSEEHTSELQSLMRISYAVFCLKKKTDTTKHKDN